MAYSAGTRPEGIRPETTEVMAERGVDISHQTSDAVGNKNAFQGADLLVHQSHELGLQGHGNPSDGRDENQW